MNRLSEALNRFDFRQRYDLMVLASVALAGLLIVMSLYLAAHQYTSAYTRQYWKEYTHTFAHSIKYGVILHSTIVSEDIIQTFTVKRL